ncbi:MAG: TolC family protein [Phycisphaerales bacterium]|nr:TolC family protein [Phycisphaerales bacterium]
MSDSLRRSIRGLIVGVAACAGMGSLHGCQNDLFAKDEEIWGPLTSTQSIGAFDPSKKSEIKPQSLEDAVEAATERGFTPPSYPVKSDVTVSEVRVSALANNLEIGVTRFDPAVGVTRINQELAKFEAILNASYVRNTTGFLTQLEDGVSADTSNANLNVSVPLVTGATITAGTLLNQADENASIIPGYEPYEAGMQFSISQPLLRGAGIRTNTASIRIAKYQGRIIDARTKLQAIRILADAEKAYWNLYRASRQLDVRVRQYEVAMKQLTSAKRRVEQGVAAEIEVMRAESGMGSTVEQVIVADNILRLRQRDLKRLMNDPRLPLESTTAIRPVTDAVPVSLRFDDDKLLADAMDGRMELLELELQLLVDSEQIDLARNAALPNFVVSYQYQYLGDDTSLGSAYAAVGNADGYTVTATANIPIGNEAAKSAVSRAILTRLQRLSSVEARKQAIVQEVLNAADTVENTWRRILAARLESVLAGRTFEGEQRQFDVGLRTSTDVLDAAARLADAQSREVDALAGYEIALIDLAFATGTTLGSAGIVLPDPVDPTSLQ